MELVLVRSHGHVKILMEYDNNNNNSNRALMIFTS